MAKKPNPFAGAGKETAKEEKAEMKGGKGNLPPFLQKEKKKKKKPGKK